MNAATVDEARAVRSGEELDIAAVDAWLKQAHPDLQGFRRLHLATRDAHGLYSQFGFVPLTGVDRWMEIRGPGYL